LEHYAASIKMGSIRTFSAWCIMVGNADKPVVESMQIYSTTK